MGYFSFFTTHKDLLMINFLIKSIKQFTCNHKQHEVHYSKVGDFHVATCVNCLHQRVDLDIKQKGVDY